MNLFVRIQATAELKLHDKDVLQNPAAVLVVRADVDLRIALLIDPGLVGEITALRYITRRQ